MLLPMFAQKFEILAKAPCVIPYIGGVLKEVSAAHLRNFHSILNQQNFHSVQLLTDVQRPHNNMILENHHF